MNVASIVGGGFELVRARPAEVLVWALVQLLTTIGTAAVLGPLFGPTADPGGLFGNSGFGASYGRMLVMMLISALVFAVLLAAAQRAVLQPWRRGIAYMRLGMEEVRQAALVLLLAFLTVAIFFGVMFAFGATITLAEAVTKSDVTLLFGILELLTLIGLILWTQVRLALAFPLTLIRGRMAIGEAWRLSRGRFLPLLGALAIILLLFLALSLPISYLSGGFPASESGIPGEGGSLLGWILRAGVAGIAVALLGGAAATAARALTDDLDGLSDTFA